jgi:hypothetical protein
MTFLETPRSRTVVAAAALAAVAIFCLLFALQVVQARAAKRSILAEQDRIYTQLVSEPAPPAPRTPVLVELFTSEGCSSCPPADALLAQLDRDQPVPNADIIVLGEHVDYWDQLGWHDRFSSPDLTQRQKNYQAYFNLDDVYTPQIVVNGSAQFNGADSRGIGSAIEKAASQTVPIQIRSVEIHPNSSPKYVAFTLMNGPATHPENLRVYAALVDPIDTTEVRGGENNGRTLHHAGVVRAFAQAGESWHRKSSEIYGDKTPFSIQIHGPVDLNGMRLVVFAQTKRIGPVLGAASCVLSATPAAHPADAAFPANPCPSSTTSVASLPSSPPQ